MKSKYISGTAIAAILTSSFFVGGYGSVAHAQKAESYQGLDEIIVTARKKEENLQDTPIAISAFSGEALDNRGLNDLSEIGNFTPNLTFDNTAVFNPTSSASSIFIRGIGQVDWTLASDPGVGLYIDGVYVARSVGGVMDLLDLERVEVLKGPQGTLFGRNTIGGAVSLVTKKPHDEFGGSVSAAYGSFNRVNLRGAVNMPLSETAALSLSGSYKNADGYVKNLAGGPDLGDENSLAGRAALRFMPSDRLEINLSADYTRERENGTGQVQTKFHETALYPGLYNSAILPASIAPHGLVASAICSDPTNAARLSDPKCYNDQYAVSIDDPYYTYGTYTTESSTLSTLGSQPYDGAAADLDLWGISGTIDYDLNDNISLKSISAYRSVEGFWTRDEDGTPVEISSQLNDYEQTQFTQEIQLLGSSFEDRLSWVLGGFYFEEEGQHLDLVHFWSDAFVSGGSLEADSLAFFGQGSYDISDQFSVTLGIRQSDDSKVFIADSFMTESVVSEDFFPVGLRMLPQTPQTAESSETNFHANAAYRWNDDLMTYASFSDGYKGVTFTQRVFPPLPEVPTADPERAESYEVGFKADLFDNKVRLNGAAFYTDYTDIQISTIDPGNAGNTIKNAAAGEIKGFELEWQASPAPGWFFDGGLGYTDAKYTELDPNLAIANVSLNSSFVNTPEWSLSFGAEYTFEVSDNWELTPRIDVNHNSEIFNDDANSPHAKQPATTLVSGVLKLENPETGMAISLEGQNLTDEVVRVFGLSDPFFFGFDTLSIAPPRTVLVKVEKTF